MQYPNPTIVYGRPKNYVPIIERACINVSGFAALYKEMERSISVSGKSKSTLNNYARQLAHLALHYETLPTDLDADQVMDYLHHLLQNRSLSVTFFKFTVFGMRFVCKLRGLEYKQFGLPEIERPKKLPVVLNGTEVKLLMSACTQLRNKLLIGLLYGCGLRCSEVRQLTIADADLERRMLHVRQGKGSKDRYVPLGNMIVRGIAAHLSAEKPVKYFFEGKTGEPLSQRATQMAVTQAVKKAGIHKPISTHTLRHTYATHLLEQGLDIVTIKSLLGHSNIETTMVYLHIARIPARTAFSPLDTLYDQH